MFDWVKIYQKDIQRYVNYRNGAPLFIIFATEQGLWALFQYRIASSIYRSKLPWIIKRPLLILCVMWQKFIEIVTGISLPYSAVIGNGLYLGHFGNIILSDKAVLGEDCNLSQGVTIGISGRGNKRGVPIIGDRVYIGVNAVVAGKINIGNDVAIAANSLVTTDVPAHVTVLGVPAQVINSYGSKEYIHPEDVPNMVLLAENKEIF